MTKKSVLGQLAEIQALPTAELKERWRELYETEPPSGSRSYLVKRLCHRLQELAYGGVSNATRARLRSHLEAVGLANEAIDASHTAQRRGRNGQLTAGTKLVRHWGNERHEVTVLEVGFEYRGKRFRSLSAIAREITGSRWNGWLYFGLRGRGQKKS